MSSPGYDYSTDYIPPVATPYPATTSGTGGDNGISLTGLSSIFSSVGTAFSQAYRSVNPQTPQQVGGTGLIYNPNTGQYVAPGALYASQTTSSLMPILLLAVGAIVIYMLVKK